MHFPLSSILNSGGQLEGLWSKFGVIKIDFGEIFFDTPPVYGDCFLPSEYHAVCQINWSELFSKAFDVTGSDPELAKNNIKIVMIAFVWFMIQVISCDIWNEFKKTWRKKQRLIKQIKSFCCEIELSIDVRKRWAVLVEKNSRNFPFKLEFFWTFLIEGGLEFYRDFQERIHNKWCSKIKKVLKEFEKLRSFFCNRSKKSEIVSNFAFFRFHLLV